MAATEAIEASPGTRARRWRWRRVAGGVAIAAVAGVIGTGAAAWFLSPSTGDVLARVRAEVASHHTRAVPLGLIAPSLRLAVVATEDERFYRHHGIDAIGLLRAAAYDVSHASLRQGASTITEQLAKDVYLAGDDHSPWRKLEDAAMAFRIESSLSKEQILDAYLNTVYFGNRAYGVAQASSRYFGVKPGQLSLGESSLLAGLVQAPSVDDPNHDPSAARARQVVVLQSLVRNHDITEGEAERALDQPLRLVGGEEVPSLRGVDLAPGPAFVGWQMAIGLGLFIAAALALLLFRARLPGMWRLAPVAGVVAGVLLAARALRGA